MAASVTIEDVFFHFVIKNTIVIAGMCYLVLIFIFSRMIKAIKIRTASHPAIPIMKIRSVLNSACLQ